MDSHEAEVPGVDVHLGHEPESRASPNNQEEASKGERYLGIFGIIRFVTNKIQTIVQSLLGRAK
jgi:hypothetical protein